MNNTNDAEVGALVDNSKDRNEFEARQWMFCPFTGNLLEYDDSKSAAVCRYTGFERGYELIHGFTTVHQAKMDEFRRKYDLDPLVKDYEVFDPNQRATRATTRETCEKCGYEELEYYTMQLRSADEGQTVFFECLKCRHKWRQNN